MGYLLSSINQILQLLESCTWLQQILYFTHMRELCILVQLWNNSRIFLIWTNFFCQKDFYAIITYLYQYSCMHHAWSLGQGCVVFFSILLSDRIVCVVLLRVNLAEDNFSGGDQNNSQRIHIFQFSPQKLKQVIISYIHSFLGFSYLEFI